MEPEEKVRAWFFLLKKLDTTNSSSGIKKSYAMLLVWALHKTSLTPLPISELRQLSGPHPEIIEAEIVDLDVANKPSWKITKMMQNWLKYQLDTNFAPIIDLSRFSEVLYNWYAENQWQIERISLENLLTVTYFTGNEIKKEEFIIDGDLKLQDQSRNLLVLGDNSQIINYSSFKKVNFVLKRFFLKMNRLVLNFYIEE